ncbi:MAG: parallel beta-helix domain-containing protein [Pirellulales bacterium]
MHIIRPRLLAVVCGALLVAGCSGTKEAKIQPGANAAKQAQTALINARPGSVIEFGEGTFEFTSTVSCDVSDVTIRGQGPDKTILSFKQQGQGTGGEGLSITSKNKVLVENLALADAKGDAVKVNGCDGLTFRNVRVSWTGGPKTENGAYGLYPVLCKNVLIEDCFVSDASDAGIYVGQSENIIVRRNRVEHNVAGIEIENSIDADVYENVATNNAGGILVFSLPDLELKVGHHTRVYNNEVVENNHENFAPKGAIVASVPSGTGVMIMANRHVEVFDNKIQNNQNAGLSICSYLVTTRPFEKDKGYDPYCEAIFVHDNKFDGNGQKPNGRLGELIASLTGEKTLPDIVYDGVIDPAKAVDGKLPPDLAIRIRNNGDADFVNFDFAGLDMSDPASPKPGQISRDLTPYDGEGEIGKLEPVVIAGVK